MGGGLGRVTKHPEYYLSDGSVSILCKPDNTLFRVHRSFFERESEIFRDLFAEAAEDDPQSGTDARPYTLHDVAANEFAQLLWVWYDREYSYQQQTKENWLVILRLSTRWEFSKIKELAVRELEALDIPPAERISIYNQYGIEDERLFSSYVELCRSPTLPTEVDGHLMQMETLINILRARENAQRKAVELGHDSPTSASLEDETLREIVSEVFKKGLDPRSSGTSTRSGVQASNLNGERAHGTSASATITLEKPQVPDRKAQSTNGPTNDPPQTSSGGRGSREKGRENHAGSSNAREKVEKPQAGGVENKGELAETTQAKEREEKEKQEKAKRDKEREEKEKQEKAKRDKEKIEKEKQEKEKEAREKGQKAEGQKPSASAWRK